MTPKLAEVLDAARAPSRSERAEIAHELIATLETTDGSMKRVIPSFKPQ